MAGKQHWAGKSVLALLVASMVLYGQLSWRVRSVLHTKSSSSERAGCEEEQRPVKPPPRATTLEEAYGRLTRHVDVGSMPWLPAGEQALRTRFLPNGNYMKYPALEMEQVCMDSKGGLVLINITHQQVQESTAIIPELHELWANLYASCGSQGTERCAGFAVEPHAPPHAKWAPGSTLHFMPYVGNSMHEFAERVWQHLVGRFLPKVDGEGLVDKPPIERFIVHWFRKWMREAKEDHHHLHIMEDRAQLLWQARMLIEAIAPNARLLVLDEQGEPNSSSLLMRGTNTTEAGYTMVCFERLLLQAHNKDRMDETRLPSKVYSPALQHLRTSVFSFFNMSLPKVNRPPSPLRTLIYLRNDTQRRRVVNANEVLTFMRNNISQPKLQVLSLDEMLARGDASYDFPTIVYLMSQIDVFVIAHGANSWNAIFLPENSLVIEIFGPCNWSNTNYTDLRDLHTWIHPIVNAVNLKHDLSNPFKEPIPNPSRGNTTQCIDAIWSVPNYTIDVLKLGKVFQVLCSSSSHGQPMC